MDFSRFRSGRLPRHTELPNKNPWKCGKEIVLPKGLKRKATFNSIHETFEEYKYVNKDLDISTKIAALRASASVVGLIARPRAGGGEPLFKASGTIYETSESGDGSYLSSILTSASLLQSSDEDVDIKIEVYIAGGRMFNGSIGGFDVHYNLAIINIHSDVPLTVAKLRHLDDSISISPTCIHSDWDNAQLQPQSRGFKICPGDMVVALGRDCKYFKIMVAPGKFSIEDCGYNCMELRMATCMITKPGVGGPLVNCFGEVIGVNFMNEEFTPFLAMNIVDKCLNHFKKYGKFCRPFIGVSLATNLYVAKVARLEHILLNNPDVFRGVFVKKVEPGSPAHRAGMQSCDVIIECNGKSVKSFLKFYRKMLDKAGKTLEVGVLRRDYVGVLKLNIAVEEFTSDRFNTWPLPEEYTALIDKFRF